MTISFQTTAIPVVASKTPKVNPYVAHAEAAVQAAVQGKAIIHKLGKDEDVKTLTRLIRAAGHAMVPAKTIRVKVDSADAPTAVTLWAIDKISREKKTEDAAPTA